MSEITPDSARALDPFRDYSGKYVQRLARAYLAEHARAEAAEAAIDAALETICGDARDYGPPLLVQLQQAVEGQTKQLADEIERYEEQYARAEAAEACAQKHLHELTALRDYLEINAQESPDTDKCFRNSEALHPDDWRRIGDFLARRDAVRLGKVVAERDRLQSEVNDLTAKLQTIMGADCGYECEIARLAARVAELEAAVAPVEWRTFEPDEPPLWMVRAHEKRGGWWRTRQVRRFRVHTNERGAYIDSKAGEVDSQQEWRCDDGNGNPLPWPVHGAEGVADAE